VSLWETIELIVDKLYEASSASSLQTSPTPSAAASSSELSSSATVETPDTDTTSEEEILPHLQATLVDARGDDETRPLLGEGRDEVDFRAPIVFIEPEDVESSTQV
jgi:hypothetical protein